MSKLAKDFSSIQDDYAFYVSHSTQNQADLNACLDSLKNLSLGRKPISFLDFGCGPGLFLGKLLERTSWPPKNVELTLVEPFEDYRRQALGNVASFTSRPIKAASQLPKLDEPKFDVVLASHVLYYVGDLSTMLSSLVGRLAPGGVFLASIADSENFLAKIWALGFKLIHKVLPYNLGDEVAAALHKLQIAHTLKPLHFQIRFVDTGENRLSIIRFLMGDYLRECPLEPLFSLFDEHSAAGEMRIKTSHMYFVINA